jgi:glycosyltransferase involved in cell wall biosynthesis
MAYRIVFYCPDSHIQYNIHTLDRVGVGGGITSRVRLAHALADRGHHVTLYVNCPKNERIRGVQYCHFSQINDIDTDIFIASSSGGNIDLGDLSTLKIRSKIRILMIHGIILPRNVTFEGFDYIYFLSNFVRENICRQINIDKRRIFISYRGIVEELFEKSSPRKRDLHNLVYMGHPVKGLDAAISILRILRKNDPGFILHVYGGNELWGEPHKKIQNEPGVIDHGMIGQKELFHDIQKMSFSLNLQSIQEGFGSAVAESMRAGCIVLASKVGAFPEIIKNGFNGFIISSDHTRLETHEEVARLILQLMEKPDYMAYIRNNAISTPFTWETIAKTWEGHWSWYFDQIAQNKKTGGYFEGCSACGGRLLLLADGLHCIDCGNYQKSIESQIF